GKVKVDDARLEDLPATGSLPLQGIRGWLGRGGRLIAEGRQRDRQQGQQQMPGEARAASHGTSSTFTCGKCSDPKSSWLPMVEDCEAYSVHIRMLINEMTGRSRGGAGPDPRRSSFRADDHRRKRTLLPEVLSG